VQVGAEEEVKDITIVIITQGERKDKLQGGDKRSIHKTKSQARQT
jgi:hypothetical protein